VIFDALLIDAIDDLRLKAAATGHHALQSRINSQQSPANRQSKITASSIDRGTTWQRSLQ
jgi:hypothetical protein